MSDDDKRQLVHDYPFRAWQPALSHEAARERFKIVTGSEPEHVFDYMGLTWAGPIREVSDGLV